MLCLCLSLAAMWQVHAVEGPIDGWFYPYNEGEPKLARTTTILHNKTKSYAISLEQGGIMWASRSENGQNWTPIGKGLLEPGKSITAEHGNYLSDRSWADLNVIKTSDAQSSANLKTFKIDLKKEEQTVGPFTVKIKSKPVHIYISSKDIRVPDSEKEWTVIAYDLEVTVSENSSKSSL